MYNATYGRIALLCALCAAFGQRYDAVQAQAVDGPTTVCITAQAAQQPQTLVVVPSGTVFATADTGRSGPDGGALQAQAVVTTETITLTHMQPCMAADASSVVSHTRHWLEEKVRPHNGLVLHAVGEVSGNGLDTGMEDEDTSLRDLVHSGALRLSINRTVQDPVFLRESDADLPNTGDGVDMSASRDAASDLPSQRHAP
ncbi:hypothetical protein PY793_01325 [Acetobacter fabarum]|uniref:hypothetical protein n=1 Tax=Acetobacter fabarum TaxID=483199 RepID=UPI00312B45D3